MFILSFLVSSNMIFHDYLCLLSLMRFIFYGSVIFYHLVLMGGQLFFIYFALLHFWKYYSGLFNNLNSLSFCEKFKGNIDFTYWVTKWIYVKHELPMYGRSVPVLNYNTFTIDCSENNYMSKWNKSRIWVRVTGQTMSLFIFPQSLQQNNSSVYSRILHGQPQYVDKLSYTRWQLSFCQLNA